MPKFPKLIEVTRSGLVIDGEDFPYPVSRDGVRCSVRPDECPSVTIELVAEEVQILDSLHPESRP